MKWFSDFGKYIDRHYHKTRFSYKLFLLIVTLLYFVYHAIAGENGYRSYLTIKQQVELRQTELQALTHKLNDLKQKVTLLSNDSLDSDMLEERCMAMLNYSYSDDIIIRSEDLLNY